MVTIVATIDLDDPPVNPPGGCVDALMWRLARERFEQHRRTPTGECVTCPRWKLCPGLGLARDGLATALGMSAKESSFWVAFTKIMASPKHTLEQRM